MASKKSFYCRNSTIFFTNYIGKIGTVNHIIPLGRARCISLILIHFKMVNLHRPGVVNLIVLSRFANKPLSSPS